MKKTVKTKNPIPTRIDKAYDSSGKRHRKAESDNPEVVRLAFYSQLELPFWGSLLEMAANGSVYKGLAEGMAEDGLNEKLF